MVEVAGRAAPAAAPIVAGGAASPVAGIGSLDFITRYAQAPSRVVREVPAHDHVFIQEGRNPELYHYNGLSGLRAIVGALIQADAAVPTSFMDFGCAYGRVLRYMAAAFPDCALTACDVREDAIAYCAETFGAAPLLSRADFRELSFPRKHDVIWMGSVVTHFDAENSRILIGKMLENLTEGGVLIFSVHGRIYPLEVQNERWKILGDAEFSHALDGYHRTGFGYHDYPGRPGIGASLTKPGWLFDLVAADRSIAFSYIERGWTGWHDIAVMTRVRPGGLFSRHKDRPY